MNTLVACDFFTLRGASKCSVELQNASLGLNSRRPIRAPSASGWAPFGCPLWGPRTVGAAHRGGRAPWGPRAASKKLGFQKCDFFTKSILTPIGPRLAFSLAFIHLGSRKVFVSPATYHPNECWVKQQGRNVMMWLDEQQLGAEFILHDRDTKFSFAFDKLL